MHHYKKATVRTAELRVTSGNYRTVTKSENLLGFSQEVLYNLIQFNSVNALIPYLISNQVKIFLPSTAGPPK